MIRTGQLHQPIWLPKQVSNLRALDPTKVFQGPNSANTDADRSLWVNPENETNETLNP